MCSLRSLRLFNSPANFAALTAVFLFSAGNAGFSAEKAAGYDDFRMIRTRHIFDPKRKSTRADAAGKPAETANPRASFLSLTGTMVTATKSLAFFSGGSGEPSKVLTLGDAYSGFKVIGISATQVEFEHIGKATTLPVGKQITAEGIVQAAAPAAPTAPAPPAAPAAENPAAANDKNEVLRRMMERREKEMSK